MTSGKINQSTDNSPLPRGLDTQAAARYLGLSPSWLRKARMGITTTPGPRFKKVGRKVIYARDSLDAFLDN